MTNPRPADRLQPTGTGETLGTGDAENDSIPAAESRPIPYEVYLWGLTCAELEREADRLTARIRNCHATNDLDGGDVAWRSLWTIREELAARRDAPLIAGFRAIETRYFSEPKRPSLRDSIRKRQRGALPTATLPDGCGRGLFPALSSDDDGDKER